MNYKLRTNKNIEKRKGEQLSNCTTEQLNH